MISRLKITAVIILYLFFSTVQGKDRDTSVVCKVLNHGWNDAKELFISPLKWDAGHWALAGGVAAGTAALIGWGDQSVYNFSNTLHSNTLDVISKYVEPGGNIFPMIASGSLFVYALLAKDNYVLETALIAGESLLLTSFFTKCAGMSFRRLEPDNQGSTSPHQWFVPSFEANSFFSGHSAVAFSVASVFAYRYRDTGWVPILSYGLAILCGLQRIYENRHWASDVLMGAAVGTATGLFLCHQWEKTSIRFYPVVSANSVQLTLVIPIAP